jgi:hypothetical protein
MLVVTIVLWGLATGSPFMRTEEEKGVQPPASLILREARVEPTHDPSAAPEEASAEETNNTQLAGEP